MSTVSFNFIINILKSSLYTEKDLNKERNSGVLTTVSFVNKRLYF